MGIHTNMRIFIFLLLILGCSSDIKLDKTIVEASCGQCQFKMEGDGCNLAIRYQGKSYWVDGTDIDDHGDAHANDGFCEAIRKAEVTGTLADGRFKAEEFKLVSDNQ